MPKLDWIGKKAVVNHHRDVPFHLLKNDDDSFQADAVAHVPDGSIEMLVFNGNNDIPSLASLPGA
jgi:hypothetical protein